MNSPGSSCNPDTFWTPTASWRLQQKESFYALPVPSLSSLEVASQAKSWSSSKILPGVPSFILLRKQLWESACVWPYKFPELLYNVTWGRRPLSQDATILWDSRKKREVCVWLLGLSISVENSSRVGLTWHQHKMESQQTSSYEKGKKFNFPDPSPFFPVCPHSHAKLTTTGSCKIFPDLSQYSDSCTEATALSGLLRPLSWEYDQDRTLTLSAIRHYYYLHLYLQ